MMMMSMQRKKRKSMEEKIGGKMKSVASIPPNYVSILQLQERWLKEKEQKHKEKEEVSTTRIVSNKDENRGDLRETKKNNPVKEGTRRVCTSKGENAIKDSIAEDTQFQNRWIKKRVEEEGETREVNGAARQGYYRNQRHDWSSRRVIRETSSMVWVKKGKNDGAAAENGI